MNGLNPIAFLIFIFAAVFVTAYVRLKRAKKEIKADVGSQPAPVRVRPDRRKSDLRRGIVMLILGVVLPYSMWLSHPESGEWAWGLVLLIIGAGHLLAYRFSKSRPR